MSEPITVVTERRLHLDDVDGFGIVFFARYWLWHQHTFEQLLRDVGHPLESLFAENLGFPVVHADIDYRSMVRLGEIVRCRMRVAEVGDRSLTLATQFTNEAGTGLADASSVHVAVGVDGSPRTIPDWLRVVATIPGASDAH